MFPFPLNCRGLRLGVCRACPQPPHTVTTMTGTSRLFPSFDCRFNGHSPQGRGSSSLEPLAPEIMEKILEHIPLDTQGQPTLAACALVATWWTGPSQRRLFSSISIHRRNYKQWMDSIVRSGTKTHLKYVRSLEHSLTRRGGIVYPMRNLPKDSGEYLSAMHNIQSLKLVDIGIERISKEFYICFSAFRQTLTNLSLHSFETSFSAFLLLVDYFPNITTLRLSLLALKPCEGVIPSLSRPLRGRICLGCATSTRMEFFDRLAKLNPQYEELVLEPTLYVEAEVAGNFLRLCASTAEYLRLTAIFGREHSFKPPSSPHILSQALAF